ADDLLKWMKWHLDRVNPDDAEARTLDHALYLNRDGLKTVSGMDESGHMDALGLAWIGMMAKDDRHSSCKRLEGSRALLPISPLRRRGTQVFIAIDKFDFGVAFAIGEFANQLLEQIAPR